MENSNKGKRRQWEEGETVWRREIVGGGGDSVEEGEIVGGGGDSGRREIVGGGRQWEEGDSGRRETVGGRDSGRRGR